MASLRSRRAAAEAALTASQSQAAAIDLAIEKQVRERTWDINADAADFLSTRAAIHCLPLPREIVWCISLIFRTGEVITSTTSPLIPPTDSKESEGGLRGRRLCPRRVKGDLLPPTIPIRIHSTPGRGRL